MPRLVLFWLMLGALVGLTLWLQPPVEFDCITDTECAEKYGGDGGPDTN